MAVHFSILAWRIPWTEESAGLQSVGCQTVGHDWNNLTTHAHKDSPYAWRTMVTTFSSVQFSHSVVSDSATPWIAAHQAPCPSPTPGVHSNSRPLSQWCHPAILSSVVPFSSCPQSLPASESFPMSQLFAWSGQSPGVSALASFLPKKTQGWSPSEWTGWIFLQSKGNHLRISIKVVYPKASLNSIFNGFLLLLLLEATYYKWFSNNQSLTFSKIS